jgi:spermidine synthase
VIPQETLGTARIPGQAGAIQLCRHDRDFSIRVQGIELMTSREHGSEEVLAELALACLPSTDNARVLVGGLGMGFTLARTLQLVGTAAQVEVVELVPEVISWNREWLGELTGHPLSDRRVSALAGDVLQRIRSANADYDAILLDVDNGPVGLTRPANDRLYDRAGLAAAGIALRPGGVLAIWSSTPHPQFAKRLRSAGYEAREERVRARLTRGPHRTIWIATARRWGSRRRNQRGPSTPSG